MKQRNRLLLITVATLCFCLCGCQARMQVSVPMTPTPAIRGIMTEQDARKHALALALQSVPETYAQRNMKPEIQFIQLRSEATPYSDATPEIDATSNPVWYVSLTGIWYTDMPAAGAQPTTPTYAHDTLTIIFDARTGKELSREYTSTHH